MKSCRMSARAAISSLAWIVASGVTLAMPVPASAVPILINGSFELPFQADGTRTQLVADTLPGWTFLTGPEPGGSYAEVTSDMVFGIPAADGRQYLDFGGNGTYGGSISQTFTTVAGFTYTVAYATGEQQGDDPAQILRAIIQNGAQTLSADNTHLGFGFSAGTPITFVATGTSATLSFLDATPAGLGGGSNIILDAVSIAGQGPVGGVPEPASWALLIAGFSVVGMTMRRRVTRVNFG